MRSSAILGISPVGFNTSTTLLVDGRVDFAVEEERLNREKRTRRFPAAGISAALAHAGLKFDDVEAVAVSWNPAINLEHFNLAQSGRIRYPGEILYSVPNYLMRMSASKEAWLTEQDITYTDGNVLRTVFVDHHFAHAASFFVSPFDDAAILTIDAFGERPCVTFSRGQANRIERLWLQEFPHSLGAYYSTFTEFCGFSPQGDEWKLMGASPYGNAKRFLPKLRELFSLKEDGSFEIDLNCFNHYQFHRPHYYSPKMAEHLGIPPNPIDRPLTEEYYDLAAAAQTVFEEVYTHLAVALRKRTGLRRLVLAGGSALNSVANGKIAAAAGYDDLFIPPVPDDSGGSLGAAYAVHCQLRGRPRGPVLKHNFFGPAYDDKAVQAVLDRCGLRYTKLADAATAAADLIADGKIIGWFQGALEFGDRALGGRSILADPRRAEMKDKVNALIKYREMFRPFAPAILAEAQGDYFESSVATPFMEKVFRVRAEKRAEIPAVVHVDGSGRLQTVTAEQNGKFHKLISAFRARTNVPVVLNTSFNVKGEPMVCAPEDALRTFFTSGLDALVIESFLLEKK
jgi:carbamoyltransferase